MTLTPEGGAAIPVSVTTTRKVQGGAAIPVYGYMTAPTDGRPAMGGAAIPVRVLTAADLKQNGGMWMLEGRPHAMPVYTAPATTTVMGGPAIAVYPVNAWPTVTPVTPPVTPWYLSGGITAANCVAAYQPKGAASLAASYINLANPGTNNAAPGTAPTFNAATGWTFVAISAQYLTTGIIQSAITWSAIVQFSSATVPGVLVGSVDVPTSQRSLEIAVKIPNPFYGNGSGAVNNPGPDIAAGNLAISNKDCFRNGVADGTIGAGNLLSGIELYIGAVNASGSPSVYTDANIKALAIYNVAITAPQVAALATAMAAL